ncbi:GGDEF domain-containing protein [Paenibacillus psychroresistens]|uniref:GGDEF domain-containing protein n=2 Tax=Paenibacillus psychroresistens TaxID=1778678 RepID=A0A6B8RMH3_9BACL|nr:GGDEF domain-containing protein [Paenibacillus psychroresistens]
MLTPMTQLDEFNHILDTQNIRMVYQPIVSLFDGSLFGYEALTRGPDNSTFHSPSVLFEFAEKNGYLYELEKLAREKAIQNSILQHKQQMLFINISSPVIFDPKFKAGQTLEVLQQRGLSPSNVVFEITERISIEDFTLAKKVLEHYRNQGYKIAIDDAGAGYSSLQAIAELQPDYIKVDRSLVQNIHKFKIKEYIMETFVTFAQKMNIHLIAEGIENEEEMMKLSRMGVHYVQGFLLGRPEPHAAVISERLTTMITQQKADYSPAGMTWTIGDIKAPIQTFELSTKISHVADYFTLNEVASGVVITSANKPIGLVMRERLFQQLAGQYGFSLFWKRSIESAMDPEPLVVDEFLQVEQVSQMAMSRLHNKLYDYVIITSNGFMSGVSSVQSILACITNVRLESARVASPLTGLPGNIQIHRELQKRASSNQKFSVIYADLDYFKWYNDLYGFQKGDQLLQFTADIIQQSVMAFAHSQDFVGHIGGDDYIILSHNDKPELLCEEIIRRFEQGVHLFYEGTTTRGVKDRQGNAVNSDGVTISLALVICDCKYQPITLEQISEAAAQLKKQAKSQKGSVYCSCDLLNGQADYRPVTEIKEVNSAH